MFCKWCGNTINSTDSHCPVCGRETPALSDCGGFYNLNNSPAAEPAVEGVRPPCPVVEKLEGRYMKDRKTDRRHHKTSLVFLVILLLLSAAVLGLSIQQTIVLAQVNESLEMNAGARQSGEEETKPEEEETVAATETEPEETVPATAATEAPEETEASVTEERSGEVTVTFGDNGVAIRTDLSEYGDVASVFGGHDAKENAVRLATVDMENAATVITLQLSENAETVELQPRISDEVFGKAAGYTCQWQYRTSSDSEWVTAEDDTFKDENDGAGLILKADREILEGLTSRSAKEVELQCIISRQSENGDMLYITVEGIEFLNQ